MKKKEELVTITNKMIQDIETDVLKKFIEVCEKNGFNYFLTYGSLIGAIRHNGYIPWDDDIDVLMPRKDYNAFISFCKENDFFPYKLAHYTTDKEYIYPIARLYDDRYSVVFKNEKDYNIGPFIDIYPLDGCGKTLEEGKSIKRNNTHLRSKIALIGKRKYSKETSSLLAKIYWRCVYVWGNIIGINHYIKKIDKKAQSFSYEDAEYVACTAWSADCTEKSIYKKSFFFDYTFVTFEGIKVRAPKDYDAFLRLMYGDYMELPPENERVGQHFYEVIEK